MEGGFTKNPHPHVSLLEKSENMKTGKFPGHQEKVSELGLPINPYDLKKSEYDDVLVKSRGEILDDENFIRKIVLAIILKISKNSAKGLAEIENDLVERCIELKDEDIETAIKQLDKKILEYVRLHQGDMQISGRELTEITTGKWRLTVKDEWGLGSKGVRSVVSFVRERIKLLGSGPAQSFMIGFNSNLDARNKVDLIEVIFGENGFDIEQLNLIQVKSSGPTEEEIDDIVCKHRDYINEEMMSLKEIGDLELPPEKEKQIFEETLNDQGIMFDRIFQICVDYEKTDQEKLMGMLGLKKLNNLHRAWILDTYFETIKEQIEAACNEGYVEEKRKDDLIRDLGLLRQTLISRTGIPARMIKINSVNSIIAVGSKIIKQVEVYSPKNERGALAAAA